MPEEVNPADRRKERRFTVGAQATIRRSGDGREWPAITRNISGGGFLFEIQAAEHPFQIADSVVCELVEAGVPAEATTVWGTGTVVRVDGSSVAIELSAGTFSPS